LEVFHGKLGVDGENAGLSLDGGVYNGTGLKMILEVKGTLGEHLADEVGENLFANITPQLGRLEIVLEIFHGAGDFAKSSGFFF